MMSRINIVIPSVDEPAEQVGRSHPIPCAWAMSQISIIMIRAILSDPTRLGDVADRSRISIIVIRSHPIR